MMGWMVDESLGWAALLWTTGSLAPNLSLSLFHLLLGVVTYDPQYVSLGIPPHHIHHTRHMGLGSHCQPTPHVSMLFSIYPRYHHGWLHFIAVGIALSTVLLFHLQPLYHPPLTYHHHHYHYHD